MFLRDKSTKKYLTFYTGITEGEIHAYIHNLFFRLCKIMFYTSVCRAYCEQLYLKNIFIYNNTFHFLHIYLGLRYKKVSFDPNFA